jgi:hypothetical protein
MALFSGSAAKAERDSILQGEGLLKKKTNNGPLSPRTNPTPSPTPLTQNKSVCEPFYINIVFTKSYPQWFLYLFSRPNQLPTYQNGKEKNLNKKQLKKRN